MLGGRDDHRRMRRAQPFYSQVTREIINKNLERL